MAIDGPAGAGKSTAARRTALRLGFAYLDTGAMYRAVALKAAEQGLDPTAQDALADLARRTGVAFPPLDRSGVQRVFVDGVDVSDAIRAPEISELTSAISAVPGVRSELAARQRALGIAASPGAVVEGRDIGTVVFPDAALKVYLDASPQERARRRAEELTARGIEARRAEVQSEQAVRDRRDSGRSTAPLRPADDAILLLTDGLTADEVVERIVALSRERLPGVVQASGEQTGVSDSQDTAAPVTT